MNITLQDVKRVTINPAVEGSEKTNRDIIIQLEDGTTVTVELWTTAEELKLEIN